MPHPVSESGCAAYPDNRNPIAVLNDFWTARRNDTAGAARKKADRILGWLRGQIEQGAAAEIIGGSSECPLSAAFGDRILWWPTGKPSGRRVSILSSRIGRQYEDRPEWFESLRLAAGTLRQDDRLVTAEGLTTHRFVMQLCDLMSLPRVEVRFASARRTPLRWFDWLVAETSESSDSTVCPVFVSPRLGAPQSLPDQDLSVSLLADQTWVLSLRKSGVLSTILHKRLSDTTLPVGSVRLLCGDGLVTEEVAEPLQKLGAVCWYLTSKDCELKESPADDERISGEVENPQSPGIESVPATGWLTHCTRLPGRWPGEEESSHVEKLVLSEAEERSPLQALLRIVSEQRLLASSEGIRGAFRVVCFSECPLAELLARRTWQKHRTRWDFEPYGICIRQGSLKKLGTAPVEYGDESTWSQLSAERRPWFQKNQSHIGDRDVDWTAEKEWRLAGDLDLSQFGSEEAFVFVASQAEAARVQPHCRWPVRVVSPD